MSLVFLISRIVFAITFILPGVEIHLVHRAQGIEMARQARAPRPDLMVPLAGTAITVAGLSVALGIWADIGALILAGYAVAIAPYMHPFWKETDPHLRGNHLGHFMKNLGLAAAALIIFYAYNQLQGSAGLSITAPALPRF
jgi:uncharacterized membrane protein YphA (DoxX/SURF4 family)